MYLFPYEIAYKTYKFKKLGSPGFVLFQQLIRVILFQVMWIGDAMYLGKHLYSRTRLLGSYISLLKNSKILISISVASFGELANQVEPLPSAIWCQPF